MADFGPNKTVHIPELDHAESEQYDDTTRMQAEKRLKEKGAEETQKQLRDRDYHMGSYGTFGMDTIHGRLFELQVDIDSLKMHTMFYFTYVLVALAVWPVAFLLAIPVSYMAGNDRDMQWFKVFLVLSTILGFILWFIPVLIVGFGGGIDHFHALIFEKRELNILDFIDFFLSELMILLLVVFALVYHHIAIDVDCYKEASLVSWRRRHSEYGIKVSFPEAQMARMRKVLDGIAQGSPRNLEFGEVKSADSATMLHLEDIVEILNVLPGFDSWDGHLHESKRKLNFTCEDHHDTVGCKEIGLFNDLSYLSAEAKQKNLWPIDIWSVRTQWYSDPESVTGDDGMSLKDGLQIAYLSTEALCRQILIFICHHPIALTVLACLSITRTFLPRLWLWYVWGGELFPLEGAAAMVVAFSSGVSITTSFFWLALFFFILMEYRRNMAQIVIISGLVDARMRVDFSQNYLMSMKWFHFTPKEAEEALEKMPLLDLRVSSNVAAFWRLREYATLDRSNERMGISILLEIVIIWLLLKFVATLLTMYVSTSGLPAVLIVTLFDLCVFGGLLLMSLKIAIDINTYMSSHKQVFVEAKYECTMELGTVVMTKSAASRRESSGGAQALADALGKEATFSPFSRKADQIGDKDEKRKDLELSRKLLEEYLDMCNENESRDHILFGMDVTPAKLVSSAASVGAMIFTLANKMIQDGRVKVPEELKDQVSLHSMGSSLFNHTMGSSFFNHTMSFL